MRMITVVLLSLALPSAVLAQERRSESAPETICVFKDEARARVEMYVNVYMRLLKLPSTQKAELIENGMANLPSYLRIVDTKSDCPKGMRIFRPSFDPNVANHFEDND